MYKESWYQKKKYAAISMKYKALHGAKKFFIEI